MKIYGTWEFLYVEITEANTQIVADQHSLQYLAKRNPTITFIPVSYKYSQQQKIQMMNCKHIPLILLRFLNFKGYTSGSL